MSSIIGRHVLAPAVFFELDGVVRRLKAETVAAYRARYQEVPPAPVDLGEQEVVAEVAAFIAKRCLETAAVPIALDMAPYLSHVLDGKPILPIEAYKQIWAELRMLLADHGVRDAKLLYCHHAGKEVPHFDEKGVIVRRDFLPQCNCRFPLNGLIVQACQVHKISHYHDEGALQVFAPSCMIGNSTEAREVSIIGSSMEFFWVEGILNGAAFLGEQTTHEHLKVAALLKENEGKIRGEMMSGRAVETHLDLPRLPTHLDRPSKITREVRVVDDIHAEG